MKLSYFTLYKDIVQQQLKRDEKTRVNSFLSQTDS